MVSIRSVFFDLYGTLLTYGNMGRAFQAWHQTLATGIQSLGKDTTVQEIKERCKNFFQNPISSNEKFTAYEIRLLNVFQGFGLEVTPEWLHHFADTSMDSWQAEIKLHPEAILLLNKLQENNIHIGIISNFEHAPHVRKVLEDTKLNPLIKTKILSAEVNLKKPDPRIFLLASSLANVPPSEILFVGDDLKEDIEGAKNAGFQTYLYKNAAPLMPILKEIQKYDS